MIFGEMVARSIVATLGSVVRMNYLPLSSQLGVVMKVKNWIIAWGGGLMLAATCASVQVAQADNLASCDNGNGCLFADSNYFTLVGEKAGGTGPFNVPWSQNDWASSYANKSTSVMTVYTDTNSGGTCGSRGAKTKANFYSPFQDSILSWSMRAGGC